MQRYRWWQNSSRNSEGELCGMPRHWAVQQGKALRNSGKSK